MGLIRVNRRSYATIIAKDGPSYALFRATCRTCGKKIGLARPLTCAEGPRPVVFEAIRGPEIEFLPHICPVTN